MPDSAPLPPIPSRRGIAPLTYAAFAAGFLVLGAHLGLATSTETRYAEIAREMQRSGDPLIPTFNGAPHLEKPPFTYWALATTFSIGGVSDVVARIPSLLAGLLTVLVVARAARTRSAGLVLATMPAFLLQSAVVSTDAWLVLSTALAGWALLECDRATGAGHPLLGRPGRWVLLLHAACGFGMLVKGPLTLLFTLAAAFATVVVRWIVTKRLDVRLLLPFVHPLGLLLFAAISLPWFLLAEDRLPGLIRLYTGGELAGKIAAGAGGHEQGPHVVWLAPLLGTWPWLGSLPAAISNLRRRGAWLAGPGLLLLALTLVAPILTTFRPGRLPSYSSPAIPFLALLVALGAPATGRADDPASTFWLRGLRAGTVGLALAAAVGFGFVTWRFWWREWTPAIALAGIVLLLFLLKWRAIRAPAIRAVAVVPLALLALSIAALSDPGRVGAHRPLWDAVASEVGAKDRFAVHLGTGRTRLEGDWGMLPFYAQRPVVFFDYPARLSVRPPEHDEPDLFRPASSLPVWFQGEGRRWLLIPTKYVEPTLGPLPYSIAASDGSYSLVRSR